MLGTPLWDEVVTRLNNKHSPQQIAHRLRQDFPEDPTMWVSHETIYQALYVQAAGGLGHELTVEKALRSGRTTRGPRSRLSGRGIRSWIGEATITNRPAEVSLSSYLCKWLGLVGLGESFGVADGEFVEGSGPALDGETLNQFPGGRALGSGFAGLFGSFTGPLVLDVADRQPQQFDHRGIVEGSDHGF